VAETLKVTSRLFKIEDRFGVDFGPILVSDPPKSRIFLLKTSGLYAERGSPADSGRLFPVHDWKSLTPIVEIQNDAHGSPSSLCISTILIHGPVAERDPNESLPQEFGAGKGLKPWTALSGPLSGRFRARRLPYSTPASERRGSTLKVFKDLNLKVQAVILP